MTTDGLDRYVRYIRRVDEYRVEHPTQRLGQALFNVLSEFDPDAVTQIHGTPLDPFHGWEVVGEFKAWLRARWGAIL